MTEGALFSVLEGTARWSVVHSDCLDVLREMPDECVDAIVTDAPYGLSKITEADAREALACWLRGEPYLTSSRGFMGRTWDRFVPGPEVWRECCRVLRPGGHLLTFAGTRTEDLMGIALRLGGLERIDTIEWLYASGFPKSVNLERAVAMDQCELPGRHFASTLPRGSKLQPGDHLCPETEESRRWKGYGSALKPAHEPIIVARKPLSGTYAENVQAHGTAMSIEACRVAHAGASDLEQHAAGVAAIKSRGGSMDESWKNASDLSGASDVTSAGRWPPNVVIQHARRDWYSLATWLSSEEENAIYDYLGIREDVRKLRAGVSRASFGNGQAQVLLEGVRWSFAEGQTEDGVGECNMPGMRAVLQRHSGMVQERTEEVLFKGVQDRLSVEDDAAAQRPALAGIAEGDVRKGEGEVHDGAIEPVERWSNPERRRVCNGDDRDAAGGPSPTGEADDEVEVHPGTQNSGGNLGGPSDSAVRSGTPQERGEGRQQTREPGGGSEVGALSRPSDDRAACGGARGGGQEAAKRKPRLEITAENVPARFAESFVLVASEVCRRTGTRAVAAHPTWDTPNRATEPSAFTGEQVSKVRHGRSGQASAERRYDEAGSTSFAPLPGDRRDVEDVDVWECVDGCPAKALGEMSGELSSGVMVGGSVRGAGKAVCYGHMPERACIADTPGDSGTCTRFFPQFADEPLFTYRAKPSRAEKDRGLQHFRRRTGAEVTGSEEGQQRLECPRTGAGLGGARNCHPTSKSVDLLRWLTRLVARPGQVVFNPFAGGGSEGVAAVLEGCRWVGVEINDSDEEPFVSIARARLLHLEGGEFIPRESLRAPVKERPAQATLFGGTT